jgi:hypothetical protein
MTGGPKGTRFVGLQGLARLRPHRTNVVALTAERSHGVVKCAYGAVSCANGSAKARCPH